MKKIFRFLREQADRSAVTNGNVALRLFHAIHKRRIVEAVRIVGQTIADLAKEIRDEFRDAKKEFAEEYSPNNKE